MFWWLTIFVHSVVLVGAALFYWLEGVDHQPALSFTDALYWAVASATTVGYGDIVAVSTKGKWLSMAMMALGSLFSALYTAIFASALIAQDLETLEADLLQQK